MKPTFHTRNKHQGKYNFKELTAACPELVKFVQPNKHGTLSINFFDSKAVKVMNKALLKSYYNVNWDISPMYLCPPIPGRADYIHHLSDLLSGKKEVKCMDIGVGANCIYPVIGVMEYGWSFVGSDIDDKALSSAREIVNSNSALTNHITFRLQKSVTNIFTGIIKQGEAFDVSMCNPPFHASKEEADKGTLRKLRNLKGEKVTKASLNFGGTSKELWCEGGEVEFVKNMILQSKEHESSCTWFTTLISKESNLKHAYRTLKTVKPARMKTISMGQGQKQSRILAWSFV
ncbi:MAG: 23S rRNA (adenine1618-N6)-methyltransferase [Glaciecola sp.]|jgi:23S rRNA (adenine1618-N6)-methyltransferase